MKADLTERQNLDHLIAGRLPEKLIEAINHLEFTIEEYNEWQESKPAIRIVVTERDAFLEIRKRLSMTKGLAALGGVIGSVWIFTQVVIHYLPDIQRIATTALGK